MVKGFQEFFYPNYSHHLYFDYFMGNYYSYMHFLLELNLLIKIYYSKIQFVLFEKAWFDNKFKLILAVYGLSFVIAIIEPQQQ